MYEMAKKAREAMKGKARKLAAEKDQKVDSSDWSPAEPLNADVKTGMRPISRRAYKKGGKVEGEACGPMHMGRKARKSGGKVESEKAEAAEYAKAKTNRDVKAANQEREGVKHIGGMKKGGRAARADGGNVEKKYVNIGGARVEDTPEAKLAHVQKTFPNVKRVTPEGHPIFDVEKRKSGGRTKKMDGGTLNKMVSPEMRRRIEEGSKTPAEMPKNPPMPPRRPAEPVGGKDTEPVGLDADQVKRLEEGRKYGGRSARKDGGKIATTLAGQEKIQKEQADASKPHRGKAGHYKDGGRAKKMMGGVMADPRMDIVKKKAFDFGPGAQGTPYKKGGKARPGKFSGGSAGKAIMMGGGLLPAAVAGMMGDDDKEKKADGGRAARKSGGRAKGKTNINIVIAAGKPATPDMMQGPGGPPMPPPGVPVPLPGGPGSMPPGAMPPPAAGPAPSMPAPPSLPGLGGPMARKSGGRTVAKSYKDMDAGAGSGEGRLEKTSIAKSGKGAPTYRRGGKVYRSYKDMDAGAGSGLGRLEKTEIASGK